MVTSLRHFIHWKHPAVLISELSEWETPLCYEASACPAFAPAACQRRALLHLCCSLAAGSCLRCSLMNGTVLHTYQGGLLGCPLILQDEHIAVAALWKASLVPELWPAPEWLLGPALATQREHTASGSSSDSGDSGGVSSSSSSSSEEESSSSSEEEEEEDSESTGSGEKGSGQGDSGNETSRRSGTVSHQVAGVPQPAGTQVDPGSSSDRKAAAAAAGQPAQQQEELQQQQVDPGAAAHLAAANGSSTSAPAATGEAARPQSMFDELDQIFMRGAGRASGGGPGGLKSSTRLSVLDRLRAAQQGPGLLGHAQGSAAASNKAAAPAAAPATAPARKAAGAVVAAAAAPPRRRALPATAAPRPAQLAAMAAAAGAAASGTTSAAASGKAIGAASEQVYIVGGKPYRQINAPGISAWVHDKLSSRARAACAGSGSPVGPAGASGSLAAAGGQGPAPAAPASPLLGFLCHIKASDQLLLVGSVRGKGGVQQLQDHPALERMRQQGSRQVGLAGSMRCIYTRLQICWWFIVCMPV